MFQTYIPIKARFSRDFDRTLGKDRGYAERTEVDQSVPTATESIGTERLLTMVKPVLIEENR